MGGFRAMCLGELCLALGVLNTERWWSLHELHAALLDLNNHTNIVV